MSDGIMGVLQFAVDGVSLEQQTTANNIANDTTPNYSAQDVSFEQSLQNAMDAPGRRDGADHGRQLDPGSRHEREQRRPAHRDDAGHPGDHAVPERGRAAERAVPAGAGRRRRELLMSLFGAMPIANSGIDAAQEWIDATGGNIANADDTGPTSQGAYQTQYVDAIPVPSGQPAGRDRAWPRGSSSGATRAPRNTTRAIRRLTRRE